MNRKTWGAVVLSAFLTAGCTLPITSRSVPATPPPLGTIEIPFAPTPPVLDGIVNESEWNSAWTMKGTFVINDGSKASGVYPFRVWVEANETLLFIAVKMTDITGNPYSNRTPGHEIGRPDALNMYFIPGYEGPLQAPAIYKTFHSIWGLWGSESLDLFGGHWDGKQWMGEQTAEKRADGRVAFTNDSNFVHDTLTWETSEMRASPNPSVDGVAFSPGAGFRMGLEFLRDGGNDTRGPDSHDMFPGDGYTPQGDLHPETWLKFRMS